MITLLVAPDAFGASEIRIAGEAYRHLFRARRLAAGAQVRVVDGRGRARRGTVARVDRTTAAMTLGEPVPSREPAFRLALLVPTCRPERASWLVEKGTEIGVAAIRFVTMERAPRETGAAVLDRLRRVAAAALEQCHRSWLPEITGPHGWNEIAQLTGAGARWFLDPDAASGLPAPCPERSGFLLVGPEGGLAPGERRELLERGWIPVGLGERVLRLETAAVVGAALILLSAGGFEDPKSPIQN